MRLTSAAAGLRYLSEIDAPFSWVHFPGRGAGPLGTAEVAHLLGVPDGVIEVRTLGHFLAGHLEQADPSDPVAQRNVGRFHALLSALESTLAHPTAFRAGSVHVRCMLLGRLPDGSIAGLETRALET